MTYAVLLGKPSYDAIAILVLGAIGGIVFALLMEKGLAWPNRVYNTNNKLTMLNFGFLADVIIGSVAAGVIFALNPPTEILIFIVIGVTSGIGGKAILTGYIKGKDADNANGQKAQLAMRYRAAIERHAKPVVPQASMALLTTELAEIDEQLLY